MTSAEQPETQTDTWTTVRVTLVESAEDEAGMRLDADRLEGLAALIADREGVGGVESRDPFTFVEGPDFVAVERPELVVYTTPEAREAVLGDITRIASMLAMAIAVAAEDHVGDAWRDAWKRHYRTLRFAPEGAPERPTFMTRPSWIAREPDDPEAELVLDPGRAFGTGLHESTRACLQLLVNLAAVPSWQPRRVLDLGCGSGILGLSALRLRPDLGGLQLTDHDPEAVDTSRENAALNGLGEDARVVAQVLDLLTEDADDAPGSDPRADFVFANIRPRVLIPAAARITRMVEPGGLLVLSGILDEEAERVRAAYPELEERGRLHDNDWTALLLARAGGPGGA
ncbi:ribosomal protein L11 methyltransferase [Plesiocystis pacifica SIR-1]|uniref:Ribosomal protein L11 methyltransferase n=1 Tax=Plesiocystis pacifica SIR-1 TaxID=391625 RepID=A6G275_9BACT|nr:50S ribosomal protein L11 methyltransferase [Plesiocystis pacifica]EDM80044.1 ribosomal protein L11 methyltransferase [Plesiocystis pacifica SIR-1]